MQRRSLCVPEGPMPKTGRAGNFRLLQPLRGTEHSRPSTVCHSQISMEVITPQLLWTKTSEAPFAAKASTAPSEQQQHSSAPLPAHPPPVKLPHPDQTPPQPAHSPAPSSDSAYARASALRQSPPSHAPGARGHWVTRCGSMQTAHRQTSRSSSSRARGAR